MTTEHLISLKPVDQELSKWFWECSCGEKSPQPLSLIFVYQAAKQHIYIPKEAVCSKCGVGEAASENGFLTDIRIVTAHGEEGYADVAMVLCDEPGCLTAMLDSLATLGFQNHHHDSTSLLEKEDCPIPCLLAAGDELYIVGQDA